MTAAQPAARLKPSAVQKAARRAARAARAPRSDRRARMTNMHGLELQEHGQIGGSHHGKQRSSHAEQAGARSEPPVRKAIEGVWPSVFN